MERECNDFLLKWYGVWGAIAAVLDGYVDGSAVLCNICFHFFSLVFFSFLPLNIIKNGRFTQLKVAEIYFSLPNDKMCREAYYFSVHFRKSLFVYQR